MDRLVARIVALLAAISVVAACQLSTAQGIKLNQPRKPAGEAKPSQMNLPGGYWALGMDAVQKEINLTDQQKQKLKDISDKFREKAQAEFERIGGLSPEQQQQEYAGLKEKMAKDATAARGEVEAVLTKEQVAAVQKITFRLQIPAILNNARLSDAVNLTAEQKKKLDAVREQLQAKMDKLQRELADELLGILTPEQQQKLETELKAPRM